jgi:hypothetical protein
MDSSAGAGWAAQSVLGLLKKIKISLLLMGLESRTVHPELY